MDQLNAEIHKIRSEAKAGNYKAALEFCTKMKNIYPNDPHVFSVEAYVLQRMGKTSAALESISKAITLEPEEACFYFKRGRYHFKQGDLASAIQDFTDTINQSTKAGSDYYITSAKLFRAECFRLRGQCAEALEDCKNLPKGMQLWGEDSLIVRKEIVQFCENAIE